MFAVNFNFLLQLDDTRFQDSGTASSRRQQALNMTLHTLRMMAHGGMHDHVGQVRIDYFISYITTTQPEVIECSSMQV